MPEQSPSVTSVTVHPGRRYSPGCPCPSCAKIRAGARRRHQLYRAGRTAIVDATTASTHLGRLRACGMSSAEISDMSGINIKVIQDIWPAVYRRPTPKHMRARIRHTTEQAILAVPLPATVTAIDTDSSDATDLHILISRGHTVPQAAEQIGITVKQIGRDPQCRAVIADYLRTLAAQPNDRGTPWGMHEAAKRLGIADATVKNWVEAVVPAEQVAA